MKAIYLLIAWSFFIIVNACGQEPIRAYGNVELTDFEVQAPDYDPDAEAIILFDVGKTRFFESETGLDISFKRLTRILILKESGLDWAEVDIPLYFKSYYEQERLNKLKACSYSTSDGLIYKNELDKEHVYEERINEFYIQKTFAMPAVKVGTIIEYEYEILSPFVVNLPDWEFQNRIPTLYSQYQVGITPFYEYTFLLQGGKPLDSYNFTDDWKDYFFRGRVYQNRVHEFVMTDIPAFEDESYITSVNDYIIKIDFQLSKIRRLSGQSTDFLTTWEALNEKLYEHEDFGGFIKKSERKAGSILSEQLPLEGLDDGEKCRVIVDYVKNNFSWNGRSKYFSNKSVKEFLKEMTGSSAEINLFLIGMLRAAGLNARPLVLSTRDHGRIQTTYPYAHFFNYVVALVDINGNLILTDGTEPLLSFARIPQRCINHEGLLIDKEGEAWVNLTNSVAFPSVVYRNLVLSIDTSEWMVKGEFVDQSNEYLALENKKAYNENPESFTDQLESSGFENVDDVMPMNLDAPGKPFVIKYNADYPLDLFEDKIMMSPFLGLPISKNELRQTERFYPVDMNYKKNWVYKSAIAIPDGYQILSSPEDFLMDNTLMKIELKTEQIETHITITGIIEFKKAVYPPEDYKKLKSFINIAIKRFNDKIIFRPVI